MVRRGGVRCAFVLALLGLALAVVNFAVAQERGGRAAAPAEGGA